MFFYAYLGAPLVSFYGVQEEVAHLGKIFKDHVFLTILIASLSPVPYKVFTISAGLFAVNLPMFIFASLVGRGIRFMAVSYLSHKYGTRAKNFIMRQQKITMYILVFLLALLLLYILLKRSGIL